MLSRYFSRFRWVPLTSYSLVDQIYIVCGLCVTAPTRALFSCCCQQLITSIELYFNKEDKQFLTSSAPYPQAAPFFYIVLVRYVPLYRGLGFIFCAFLAMVAITFKRGFSRNHRKVEQAVDHRGRRSYGSPPPTCGPPWRRRSPRGPGRRG